MAATVIATIAIVGLAYTFGLGRGFIDHFEIDRAAAAAAQGQLERIASVPSNDSLVTPMDRLHMSYFIVGGAIRGTQRWVVRWMDDPADSLSPEDGDPSDLRMATVTVVFPQGSAQDSVVLSRVLPAAQ